MTYSIKVRFGTDYEVEAGGESIDLLVKLINEATKKFFPDTKWTKDMKD